MPQISQDEEDLGPTVVTRTRKDKWTLQENNILAEMLAASRGIIAIADVLGRSSVATESQARKLNLAMPSQHETRE